MPISIRTVPQVFGCPIRIVLRLKAPELLLGKSLDSCGTLYQPFAQVEGACEPVVIRWRSFDSR
jgi:hypothetical protein